MTKPWDRMKGESEQAFAAFSAYRNMGVERSLDATSDHQGKNTRLMSAWSVKHSWVERARAYDNHIQAIELKEREKRAKVDAGKWEKRRDEQKDLEYGLAIELINKGREILKVASVEKCTPKDAVPMFDLASKLMRLALELATDRVIVETLERIDVRTLTDEQLERIANGEDPVAVVHSRSAEAEPEGPASH